MGDSPDHLASLSRARVSSALGSTDAESTNAVCRCDTSGVAADENTKFVIAHPAVAVICWGTYYHPIIRVGAGTRINAGLDAAKRLCQDLLAGQYVNQLSQYGVGHGSVVQAVQLNVNPPATLTEAEAATFLKGNIPGGVRSPAVDEANLLYVLFLDPATKPTVLDSSGMPLPTGSFCGYHKSAKYNDNSVGDDLFYAVIRTDNRKGNTPAGTIANVAYCVSHELAEIVTNPRDTQGYTGTQGCEISDLCETGGKCGTNCCTTFGYRNWNVEQYWSNWASNCVRGDDPVSMRNVLSTTVGGFSFRALKTPIINIEYIASRYRNFP
ncbi:hypothetical protein KO481_14465 [Nocardia sp. NEAU-G5]|uniref:Uncharacterized protein n=2 Tax=Nocardia albiluteola TaxID=2842303 RepID=A0ABS6AXC6_9NOCA|nr:hypothetical protein [Nocardia albiluteola]